MERSTKIHTLRAEPSILHQPHYHCDWIGNVATLVPDGLCLSYPPTAPQNWRSLALHEIWMFSF